MLDHKGVYQRLRANLLEVPETTLTIMDIKAVDWFLAKNHPALYELVSELTLERLAKYGPHHPLVSVSAIKKHIVENYEVP